MTSARSFWIWAGGIALTAILAGLAILVGLRVVDVPGVSADGEWRAYEGGPESQHYSPLDQITRANVDRLAVAWTYPAGESPVTFNPLVIDGTAYLMVADGGIAALDGATGREIWKRPKIANAFRNRSFAYWESADRKNRRLFFNNRDRLYAIDARTGADLPEFGEGGSIDLRENLGRDVDSIQMIASGTPGRVFGNLLILGSSTGEEYDSPPGDIRAYDVRTGKHVWSFHTIPHPGEAGHETWPADAWKRGAGADNWGGLSLDEKRGLVYIVTASAKFNFWGGNRKGKNLFANSIVAIDANNGKYVWHFQMVHHDLWDYDNAASPVLLTVKHQGTQRDIVAVAGKTGFLYVFDRATGKPLWPIDERPVAPSDMPGEEAWPTQPFPSKPAPFSRQAFSVTDVDTNLPAEEYAAIVERVKAAKIGPIFTPPGTGEMVQVPGHRGGSNWGMTAGEPKSGRMYVASFDFPVITKLEYRDPKPLLLGATPYEGGKQTYQWMCQTCHGADLAGQPPAIPSLIGVTTRQTPQQIITVVQHGRAPMPAFPEIKGQAAGDLIAFLSGDKDSRGSIVEGLKPGAGASRPSTQPRWRSEYGFWFTKAGNPVVRPPWSWLTAYNLNSGEVAWRRPIGEDPDYNRRGIYGTGQILVQPGIAVTGGGLLFVSTHRDRTLWVLDRTDGRTLRKLPLPAPPLGIPSVYGVGGRQFVLVPATGSGNILIRGQTRVSAGTNSYVAFALPRRH